MSDYGFFSFFRQIPLKTWKKIKKIYISKLSQGCQETEICRILNWRYYHLLLDHWERRASEKQGQDNWELAEKTKVSMPALLTKILA